MVTSSEIPQIQPVDQIEMWIGQTRQQIRSAAQSAMQEVGGIAEDGLRERLNTPYPPASEPYTDPHRRTGELSAGVHFVMADESEDEVTVLLISSREGGNPAVPMFLENGTSKMAPRQYMLRTQEEWNGRLAEVFEPLFWEAMNR